jgi:hypothetical protein
MVGWAPLRSATGAWLLVMALCTGCSTSDGGGTGVGGAGGVGGASGGLGGAAPSYQGTVEGVAVDVAGDPIEGLGVSLCFTVCRITETDAGGTFRFDGVDPAVQVIENIGLPGDDPRAAALGYSKFFDFVDVGLDEQIVIDRPFVVPSVVTEGPLSGPQAFSLAGGLEVAFDADRFGTEDNPLPTPAMALHFGAAEIPEVNWPTRGYDGWRILRAWAFAVWDLHAEDAFTVTAPLGDAGPLPADSDVAFLVADYTYGFVNGTFFEEAAEVTPDGTALVTPAGAGIDRATLLLAVVRDAP